MRKALDALYLISGIAACIFLAGIAALIMGQIIARMAGLVFDSTEISGFFMSAATFLGLAYTFRDGGHVRVSLVIHRLNRTGHRAFELWCCLFSAAVVGYLAWEAFLFTSESFQYHDLSPGYMAIPFWIPQSGMTFGLALLSIAMIDAAVAIARGHDISYEKNAGVIE